MSASLHQLAPELWTLGFPLKTLGADLRRNVTILRLSSGKLIIHSTGPFTSEQVAEIHALGEPGWLIDTLLRHDTFTEEGRAAFPSIPYLVPAGFPAENAEGLLPPPGEWAGEVEVLEIAGAPEMGEHVIFHRASRTLIVADLVVNFGPDEGLWSELLLKVATIHGHHNPGMTKLWQKAVKDQSDFRDSLRQVLAWDFDRLIVGHGDPIHTGAKEKLSSALQESGFLD